MEELVLEVEAAVRRRVHEDREALKGYVGKSQTKSSSIPEERLRPTLPMEEVLWRPSDAVDQLGPDASVVQ